MSVSGSSSSSSSALSTLTNANAGELQQTIAAKILRQQMDHEASLVAQLMEAGNRLAEATSVGLRVDFRA